MLWFPRGVLAFGAETGTTRPQPPLWRPWAILDPIRTKNYVTLGGEKTDEMTGLNGFLPTKRRPL